jgi:O-acetyl-ADP-ribose deacetylase (regulator of RNase III)
VNCIGVAGAGLAKDFAERYPRAANAYRVQCRAGNLVPGMVLVLSRTPATGSICCLPTKRHWRDGSRLEDVEAGLRTLASSIQAHGWSKVAVPAVGCGLGGLSWSVVWPAVRRELGGVQAEVMVYGPGGG